MHDQPYQPAAGVLQHVQQVDFVAVVGPTAVGKTTLIDAAVAREPRLAVLLTSVSRPPRPGERDGIDGHFLSKRAMDRRVAAGEYVTAVRGASGDWYATAPEDYHAGKTAIMAVMAHAMPMFRGLPFRSIRSVFILPPSYEVWQERLHRHQFQPEDLRRRLVEAQGSLVFGLEDKTTRFVWNETIELGAEDLAALSLGRPLSPRLQADQSRCRELAAELLERLRRSLAAASDH